MAKATCKEMTLFNNRRNNFRALAERQNYLQHRIEDLGDSNPRILAEDAALKYCLGELRQKQIELAKQVVEVTKDDNEREICQKFLDKWS